MRFRLLVAFGVVWLCGWGAQAALATPAWLCVPAGAGQAAVSGGTGTSASCPSGAAAVDAQVLGHTSFIAAGVGGKPTVRFTGVNVQVVSGSGTTNGTVNGEGNLVVGYAENPSSRARTGSNDLILGYNNGWSGYGELVAGEYNIASGAYATTAGVANTASAINTFTAGRSNTASGNSASVLGGEYNKATNPEASVAGGCDNIAGAGTVPTTGCASGASLQSVTGGIQNQASGNAAAATGGKFNTASNIVASVSGGFFNKATGQDASVSGGFGNAANGSYASVSGGDTNAANADFSSIGGGFINKTTTDYSAVSGGCGNDAGGTTAPDTTECSSFGGDLFFTWIGGGEANYTTGQASSVSGGYKNNPTGQFSSILGGGGITGTTPHSCSDVTYGFFPACQ